MDKYLEWIILKIVLVHARARRGRVAPSVPQLQGRSVERRTPGGRPHTKFTTRRRGAGEGSPAARRRRPGAAQSGAVHNTNPVAEDEVEADGGGEEVVEPKQASAQTA